MPAAPEKPLPSEGQAAMDLYRDQLEQYESYSEQMQTQFSNAQRNYAKNQAIFTNGFLGLSVLSETGRSECTFEDTWVWIIDQ
jgi:hypothetical protein